MNECLKLLSRNAWTLLLLCKDGDTRTRYWFSTNCHILLCSWNAYSLDSPNLGHCLERYRKNTNVSLTLLMIWCHIWQVIPRTSLSLAWKNNSYSSSQFEGNFFRLASLLFTIFSFYISSLKPQPLYKITLSLTHFLDQFYNPILLISPDIKC